MQPTRLLSNAFAMGIALCATLTTLRAQAQTPGSANTDIVKMIQAGLPESVIVGKIREGAGRWDTSVDALIALKKIGATEIEMNALAPLLARGGERRNPPSEPVTLFGGQLLYTRAGDPYLQFISAKPEVFPNGLTSNAAHLVMYKNQIAVLIPSSRLDPGSMDCHPFNALFLRDSIAIDRYMGNGCRSKATVPKELPPVRADLDEYPKAKLRLDRNKTFGRMSDFKKVGVYDRLTFTNGDSKAIWSDQIVFGMFPIHFDSSSSEAMRADSLGAFIEHLMSDFDNTVAELERAAGISDPNLQLSKSAHYLPVTLAQANQYRLIFNDRWEEKNGGNGWLTALNAIQGVANMQQAMQDAKVADATHSGAAQLSAAVNLGKTEIDAIGSVSNPTTALQSNASIFAVATPIAPIPTHAQATPSKSVFNNESPPAPNQSAINKVSPSTATAPPPNCVYLSDAQPCVPLAKYSQTQQQATLKGAGICPASGFVPGVALHIESDLAVGVPCKPGTPYGPLIATTASGGFTGVTPPDPATGGSGGGSSQGGSSSEGSGDPSDPVLNSCIALSYKSDPITGTHLVIQNNCSVAAHVLFYASSQVNGGVHLSPGDSTNTYQGQDKIQAAGGVSIYACPEGDIPREADGTLAYNGVNNQFRCSRK